MGVWNPGPGPTDGDDTFTAGDGGETADGGLGLDTLLGGAGNDVLIGGGGDDLLVGGAGNDAMTGGAGNDEIRIGEGNDQADGGDGDDVLEIWGNSAGTHTVLGGAGNDTVVFYSGGFAPGGTLSGVETIVLFGGGVLASPSQLSGVSTFVGQGISYLTLTVPGVVDFTNVNVPGSYTLYPGTNLQHTIQEVSFGLQGTSGDDTFIMPANAGAFITLIGLEGNDTLIGGGNNDHLLGFAGNDTMIGGGGDDTIEIGAGNETIDGGAGNDQIVLNNTSGEQSAGVIDGGAGSDTLMLYAGALNAGTSIVNVETIMMLNGQGAHVTIAPGVLPATGTYLFAQNWLIHASPGTTDLSGATMPAQFVHQLQLYNAGFTFQGSSGDDGFLMPVGGLTSLTGYGNGGNDTLRGGANGDWLDGGAGNDMLTGGGGSDKLDGGLGEDTAVFSGVRADYYVYGLQGGTVTVIERGGAGDRDVLTSVEHLVFADGESLFYGPNAAPVARAGGPYVIQEGGSVVLDGSGSSDANTIMGDRIVSYAWEWDFNSSYDDSFTSVVNLTWWDFEHNLNPFTLGPHYISLRVTDMAGAISTSNTSIYLNAAPNIASNAALTAAENGLAIATLATSDENWDETFTYSIVGGLDAGLFALNASTGALSFVSAQDFEAPGDSDGDGVYEVVVRVDDAHGGVDTQAFSISLTDQHDSVLGTAADDVMTAGAVGGEYYGLGGNDSIVGSAVGDGLFGGEGDDALAGGGGADVLNGGAGLDALNGGAGVDTAHYAVASAAASWTRAAAGGWTVNAGADGADTLTNVEFLHFTDRDVFLDRAARNFSGNGTSDILFRRTDGVMAAWEVTGATINSASFLPTAGPEWRVLGTGDIGGDGRDDIIWQRSNGLVYAWTMNGGAFAGGVALAGIGPEWSFLGLGDFNGDLTDDFAWRRNDGIVFMWQMHNSSIQSTSVVTGVGADWALQGVGDFNGDGRDDFLWRNGATGQTVIWRMDGATIAGSGATSLQAGADWSVVGVGDTNGDGRDDIVLQRASDGMVAVWAMNGTTVLSAANVAAANPNQWSVHGVGDYNGDGRDDILWQHDNGLVYVWLMNGASIAGAGGLSGVGAAWTII